MCLSVDRRVQSVDHAGTSPSRQTEQTTQTVKNHYMSHCRSTSVKSSRRAETPSYGRSLCSATPACVSPPSPSTRSTMATPGEWVTATGPLEFCVTACMPARWGGLRVEAELIAEASKSAHRRRADTAGFVIQIAGGVASSLRRARRSMCCSPIGWVRRSRGSVSAVCRARHVASGRRDQRLTVRAQPGRFGLGQHPVVRCGEDLAPNAHLLTLLGSSSNTCTDGRSAAAALHEEFDPSLAHAPTGYAIVSVSRLPPGGCEGRRGGWPSCEQSQHVDLSLGEAGGTARASIAPTLRS